MSHRLKRRLADLPPGSESPLAAAVTGRDSDTLSMVRNAIAHGETLLAYQPVVTAADPSTIAFHEGLIRVLDPTGRVIPARDFMSVIEDSELGREIDVLALRGGLTALNRHPGLRLSVNMSARSIGYRNWRRTLDNALRRDPTLAERLILEVTEASVMRVPELVADFMEEMQTCGVCFALDDFGAGPFAIRYFKDFYFDVLKIDGQFVHNLARDPDNRLMTGALLNIARHFEMMTVAARVENAADAAVLAEMGVDCLQGYHIGAPTTRPDWQRPNHRRAG